MNHSVASLSDRDAGAPTTHLPTYWGWLNIIVAAIAMTSTLPGRTHGLGLITEPMLRDLAIEPIAFARMNFISALIGASFCLPIGWLIDRWGVRSLLAVVTLALGISVVAMSAVASSLSLLICLILVRGFGQSALSLLSIAVIAKWFQRRLGIAMGVFAVLLTFGFIASVLIMGSAIEKQGWMVAWRGLGWTIIGLAPFFWLLTRDVKRESNTRSDWAASDDAQDTLRNPNSAEPQWTLNQALVSLPFWIMVLGCSAFNLVWSGVTLFNESIAREHGLDQAASVEIMAILTGVGLLANLICGGMATRERILKLLGIGLGFLAMGLAIFATVHGQLGARIYAISIGLSGGVVTVVFFSAWRHLFGETQLGRIQGAAQLATVLASATGPVLLAESFRRTNSYQPIFITLAALVGILACLAFWIRIDNPVKKSSASEQP